MSKGVQLIQDQKINLSEYYMSVGAKINGGKQINCFQSGSCQHHYMVAALRLTLGPTWTADSYKHFLEHVPVSDHLCKQIYRKTINTSIQQSQT